MHATSGSAPASVNETPSGIGSSCAAGTDDLLRVAAAGEQRARLVADLPAADAGSDLADPPGALQAGELGGAGRRRVVPLALHDVGAVHPGGHDVEDDLAAAGLGVGLLGPLEDLGATRLADGDAVHDGGR